MPLTAGISQGQQSGEIQRSPSGIPVLPESANPHPDGVRLLGDSMRSADAQKRLTQINLQRQKEMTSETARLLALARDLALATELKRKTDKAGNDSLSMLEVRKAELIEKLARSVREQMKASIDVSSLESMVR